eukprot:853393-Amphidinium_carterae.1
MFEEETEWAENYMQQGSDWSTEADELLQLYEEGFDVGEDSEGEEYIWVLATDLSYELDEQVLDQQLASFSQVQKQKNLLKKARGWFAPDTWKGGSAKGTEKGKHAAKGLSTSPLSSGISSKSGKGLSKGKGSGKTKGKYDAARQKRDERRS